MLTRLDRDRPVTVVDDKGDASREFEQTARQLKATMIRPQRRDKAGLTVKRNWPLVVR